MAIATQLEREPVAAERQESSATQHLATLPQP